MDANDEKINAVIQFASTLVREGHLQGNRKKNILHFKLQKIEEKTSKLIIHFDLLTQEIKLERSQTALKKEGMQTRRKHRIK